VVLLVLGVGYGISYPGAANPDSYSSGWVPPWASWPTPLEALMHEIVIIAGIVGFLASLGIVVSILYLFFVRLRKWAYS